AMYYTNSCAPPPSLATFPFFYHDTSTTDIYTLSLHDALPISRRGHGHEANARIPGARRVSLRLHPRHYPSAPQLDVAPLPERARDRKSTRLNSSHLVISYAVFCLKKKTKHHTSQ